MALVPLAMENSPHQSGVAGDGSQPDNHTGLSQAFCLFYEKKVLLTGFTSKFIPIEEERKFL